MKREEIVIGGVYWANVSGNKVRVKVTEIRKSDLTGMRYDVTNLATNRGLTFKSAQRFLANANPPLPGEKKVGASILKKVSKEADAGYSLVYNGDDNDPEFSPKEGEQRPNPTGTKSSSTSSTVSGGSLNTSNTSAPKTQTENNCSSKSSDSTEPIASPPTTKTSPDLASILSAEASSGPIDNAPHLIVEARAGTGKTTTLIEGLKELKGIGSTLTPSPQQRAVWDSICLSKGVANSICFVAFNKAIAEELKKRVPAGVDAMTMHGMGFRAVGKAFTRVRVEQYRVSNIIEEITGQNIRELRFKKNVMIRGVESLVGLCKMNLVGGILPVGDHQWDELLQDLADYYDIDLEGHAKEVFDLVPKVLERCKDVSKDGCIDFDDMIWIPVVLDLSIPRHDLLLVDEAQDLNRCQQALAKKAGKRLILCGDRKQAIYGFAGADSESLDRMHRELVHNGRGCQILPLTVTRRCGKAIVKEANKIVSDFEAFESNGEGNVSTASYQSHGPSDTTKSYHGYVQEGDMVLCRVTAPLVSQCFKFIKAGRKANIQGRDIGQGLISTVNKMKATSVSDLVGKLDDWLNAETKKETVKRNPNEHRLIALQDRFDCLICFTEGVNSIEEVIKKIESIFTNDKNAPGIRLSSIHKAKGLEAIRVFFLMPKGGECPHPAAKSSWQRDQENNLLYVGITRAIEELIFVR